MCLFSLNGHNYLSPIKFKNTCWLERGEFLICYFIEYCNLCVFKKFAHPMSAHEKRVTSKCLPCDQRYECLFSLWLTISKVKLILLTQNFLHIQQLILIYVSQVWEWVLANKRAPPPPPHPATNTRKGLSSAFHLR